MLDRTECLRIRPPPTHFRSFPSVPPRFTASARRWYSFPLTSRTGRTFLSYWRWQQIYRGFFPVSNASNVTARVPTPSPAIKLHSTSLMEVVGRRLRQSGLPEDVIRLLSTGVRVSTRAAYQSAWWCNSSRSIGSDPFRVTLNHVLTFLTSLFSSGKAYSTINFHLSMFSSTFAPSMVLTR